MALFSDKTSPRMETSNVISTDKATVIIQVNPHVTEDSVIFVDGQEARRTKHNTLTEFFKAQPKELGVMHLMIYSMVLGLFLLFNLFWII